MALTEDEREALALVGLKNEERDASREVTRLRNLLIAAERAHEQAQAALKDAREKFLRKVQ